MKNAYGVDPAQHAQVAKLEQAVVNAAIAWEKTDHAQEAWITEASDLVEAVRKLLNAREGTGRT